MPLLATGRRRWEAASAGAPLLRCLSYRDSTLHPKGASRSLGPGRLPLPFLLSSETWANRSAGWLISGTVLRAPVRGDMPEFGSDVTLSLPPHPGKQAC